MQQDPVWIKRRKVGNEKATAQLRIAAKVATLLSRFPFVRGVAVSGSLSKHFAGDNADIDFFIIKATNRLWLARTFMHLFKKLTFLAGRQHWFCRNYYVDESALEIKEKNIFTATEIVTVLPFYGDQLFRDFIAANTWVEKLFPHYVIRHDQCKNIRRGILKSVAEFFFNNRMGDWLDNVLMKKTLERWQKKTFRKMRNGNGVLMGMDGGKHYAKPVPGHLQEKVVIRFNLKMEQLLAELKEVTIVTSV